MKKAILTWDESEIMDELVNDRLENDNEDKLTADQIREEMYQSNPLEFEWEYFLEALEERLQKKNPDGYWRAEVKNFGWRGLNGGKYFKAENAQDFLHAILPNCDCTFKIYNNGKGLSIQNWHHDSPTGNEWYYIKPVAWSTYDKNYC